MKKDNLTIPIKKKGGIFEMEQVIIIAPYNANSRIFNPDYHIMENKLDGLKVYTLIDKKEPHEPERGAKEDEIFISKTS